VRIKAALLLLLFAPSSLHAQPPSVEGIDITNRGIYEIEVKKKIDDENLVGSYRDIVTNIRRIKTTTNIPARLCISFGLEYIIVGAPSGVEIPIKMVTRFPKQGLYNPDTKLTVHWNETVVNRTIGKAHFRSYTLDKEWEVVPGVWTFELWYQGRRLVEQMFNLVEPCANGCDKSQPQPGCGDLPIPVSLGVSPRRT